eukprot:gene41375-55966_t
MNANRSPQHGQIVQKIGAFTDDARLIAVDGVDGHLDGFFGNFLRHLGRAALKQARGAGHVSITGSVAGFRGLPKSLAYGPTKAALTNLAEVLYVDLHARGIGVSVVQPGFVDTPLTAKNDFRMPALITPAQAAEAMLEGWRRGDFEIHFPRRFTFWMKLMRLLPYRLYFPAVARFTGLATGVAPGEGEGEATRS